MVIIHIFISNQHNRKIAAHFQLSSKFAIKSRLCQPSSFCLFRCLFHVFSSPLSWFNWIAIICKWKECCRGGFLPLLQTDADASRIEMSILCYKNDSYLSFFREIALNINIMFWIDAINLCIALCCEYLCLFIFTYEDIFFHQRDYISTFLSSTLWHWMLCYYW